ncbi:MAG: hypothetical protein WCO44_10650 [Bacteroidota bacterium]
MTEHRDEFDSSEPDPGHFRRFEERLGGQEPLKLPVINRTMMLKIAALILLMITVAVFVFDLGTREIRERFSAGSQANELPAEIRQAIEYYDIQTTKQLGTMNKLAANHMEPGVAGESAMNEIRNLDAATEELKTLLADNPGNEHILDAIIQNQQMKESVLTNIISQISQKK